MNGLKKAEIMETFRRSPKGAAISLVLALLYGVSPIDLIPDVLFLVGWADDAVIVPVLLALAWSLWRRRTRKVPVSGQIVTGR
jgi:uncharacterized membrane protein YkvA (DUF1232 family)